MLFPWCAAGLCCRVGDPWTEVFGPSGSTVLGHLVPSDACELSDTEAAITQRAHSLKSSWVLAIYSPLWNAFFSVFTNRVPVLPFLGSCERTLRKVRGLCSPRMSGTEPARSVIRNLALRKWRIETVATVLSLPRLVFWLVCKCVSSSQSVVTQLSLDGYWTKRCLRHIVMGCSHVF